MRQFVGRAAVTPFARLHVKHAPAFTFRHFKVAPPEYLFAVQTLDGLAVNVEIRHDIAGRIAEPVVGQLLILRGRDLINAKFLIVGGGQA